ncbi:MAG: hypothetical protein WA192_01760 [Candidatus Acidiferrales bacterium]
MYLPDTNILIDLGKDSGVQIKLDGAERRSCKFVIGPTTIKELVVGVVGGGARCYEQNKKIFVWLKNHSDAILDNPGPFAGNILGLPSKRSWVGKCHHVQLIEMVAQSQTFAEFKALSTSSVWSDIRDASRIHGDNVDKEFTCLEQFAEKPDGNDITAELCKGFAVSGVCPDPKIFRQRFSAAVEYIEASVAKIRAGAKPWKNDRGRYGDFQLFFYLADPNITLLTNDDFSGDIEHSPQRTRIVGLDAL